MPASFPRLQQKKIVLQHNLLDTAYIYISISNKRPLVSHTQKENISPLDSAMLHEVKLRRHHWIGSRHGLTICQLFCQLYCQPNIFPIFLPTCFPNVFDDLVDNFFCQPFSLCSSSALRTSLRTRCTSAAGHCTYSTVLLFSSKGMFVLLLLIK